MGIPLRAPHDRIRSTSDARSRSSQDRRGGHEASERLARQGPDLVRWRAIVPSSMRSPGVAENGYMRMASLEVAVRLVHPS